MIVNFTSTNQNLKPQQQVKMQPAFGTLGKQKADVVSFRDKTEKPEGKGEKLSVISNIVRGIVKPIQDIAKAFIEAPLPTGLVVASIAAVIHFLPVVGTALAVGVCGFGAYKIASSTMSAIKAANTEKAKEKPEERDFAKANLQLREVGEGIFDVALTAGTAINGVKQLANTAKMTAGETQLNTYQKLYAFIKQLQNREGIPAEVSDFNTFIQRIKGDGLNELALLKQTINNNNPIKVSELEKLLDTVNKDNAGKASELFGELAKAIKNEGPAKTTLGNAAEWLKAGKFDTITANKTAILNALNTSNIDSMVTNPELVKLVNQFMRVANPDDAAKFITKIVNKGPDSKTTLGVTGITTDDEDINKKLK